MNNCKVIQNKYQLLAVQTISCVTCMLFHKNNNCCIFPPAFGCCALQTLVEKGKKLIFLGIKQCFLQKFVANFLLHFRVETETKTNVGSELNKKKQLN